LGCEWSNVVPISSSFSSVYAAFSYVYFLSKTKLKALSSLIKKLLMKMELGYQKTYSKTFSYTSYMIYHTGKPTFQVYISPSHFNIATDFWMILQAQKHKKN
jgi:hypothetical protein